MTKSGTIALMSFLLAWASDAGARERSASDDENDAYVVVMTEKDSSARALFERYPELDGSWDKLAKFNLLRAGHVIEIPRDMLASDGVLAKVANMYGEAEVKRSFDDRFIPIVPNLLLREGDEIRTWRGSGVRILFEDGNYVFVNSHSKVKVVSLGKTEVSGASRLQVLLKEGSVWSRIENKLKGRYEIRTAGAITTIRGTDFRVKVEPGDATRVEVLDGSVDFEAGDSRITVGSQQGALANGSEGPLAAAPLPPPPDELVTPQPQEVIRGEAFNQLFEWTPVSGARAYWLVISRDDRFFDKVVERRVGPEPSVRIANLDPGTYFWRVSTERSNGFEGSPSESRYFVFVRPQQ